MLRHPPHMRLAIWMGNLVGKCCLHLHLPWAIIRERGWARDDVTFVTHVGFLLYGPLLFENEHGHCTTENISTFVSLATLLFYLALIHKSFPFDCILIILEGFEWPFASVVVVTRERQSQIRRDSLSLSLEFSRFFVVTLRKKRCKRTLLFL